MIISICNFSGSTCVSVMTIGRKLYVANVGDSRGILIKSIIDSTENKEEGDKCDCIALTRDHKPDDV